MIVVAGGTGRLGTLVVRRLAGRGLSIRVLTRDSARAEHLAGPHVEVVNGDVRDRGAVAAACEGATVVVSAVHGFIGPRGISPATLIATATRISSMPPRASARISSSCRCSVRQPIARWSSSG